jgi:Protein of unknown function, DUF547
MKKTILSFALFFSFLTMAVSQNSVKSKSAAICSPSRHKVAPKKSENISANNTPVFKEDIRLAVVENKAPEPVIVSEKPVVLTEKTVSTPTPTAEIKVTESAQKAIIETPVAHADFDVLMKKHVSASGKVNYKGFNADKAALETYIAWLSENVPTAQTVKNEKLAYWINAYNALTIKLILDNYPLPKITNLDGGKTWDVKRFTLGGKKYSLNDIENTIVRPMGEPRIHFALNCAAKSCPPLFNEAFVADKLTAQLEARTRKFINDPKYNVIKGSDIKISNIFNWYGKDFDNVVNFINRYAAVKLKSDVKIGFGEYDWNLNE